MAPRTKKRARRALGSEKGKAPAVRGLAVGTLVRGWKVFRPEGDEDDSKLAPEKLELKSRYRALEVDVRRMPRRQVTRLRQLVAAAASRWDDVNQKPADQEEREAALQASVEAQEAVLEAYREVCLASVEVGGQMLGAALVQVRPIVVELPDGSTTDLETLSPEGQVDYLDELGLLDSVGRAVLEAQSTELQNLHL